MNKTEALQRLTSLEDQAKKLRDILEAPEVPQKTKEERFLELIDGLTVRVDKKKYPNSLFYFKGDKYFFELEDTSLKDTLLYCSCPNVWDVFVNEYHIDNNEIRSFLKQQAAAHFKINGMFIRAVTTCFSRSAEQHFKELTVEKI